MGMTLDTMIVARTGDIGGFQVRRALPSVKRRMVGPFVFLDQMGPAEFLIGHGLDVRPHPHIGLATVTYLFDGEIMHRDSLGTVQAIRPGAVNWMTAGRGISHSERTAPELRSQGFNLFVHHAASTLPIIQAEGKTVRVIAGSLYGESSPVETPTATFYADAALEAGARIPLPAEHEERAVYVAQGKIDIAGDTFEEGQLLVFRPGDEITITALDSARVMLLGGEPMDGPRHIWWNFVSSSQERIEQAKADWKAGRFGAVPDDDEFIPLPER
jgi:redox-sensitive bicupin YhaK (pirin superfamily)